jgi:hypothetical protein
MAEQIKFEEWAILELMGHRRLAGKVTDAVIGGGAFIRIDIPTKDNGKITQFYSPNSVYCISPTTQEIATMVAINSQPEPVSRWELKPLLIPHVKDDSFPYTMESEDDKNGD